MVFNETLSFNDNKIQSIVIPVQLIQELLWVDYITCKGAFVDMISKGVIIFDNSDFLFHLIPHTKKLKKIGGRPLSEEEIYMSRVKITSLLHDIMGANNREEILLPVANLIDSITEFKLKINGNWCGNGKSRMRQIMSLNKKDSIDLNNSVSEIYCKNDTTKFVEIITKELNKYGGLLPYYSKANSLSKVSDDYLVIEIEVFSNNKKNVINTLNMLFDFLNNLNDFELNYYYFSSKPVGKNKIGQNIYFVIEAKEDIINNYIIDRLNFLVKKKKLLTKVTFPFQFDPIYKFLPIKNYNLLSQVFCKASKLVHHKNENLFNQNFQMTFSLQLFSNLKRTWFGNNRKKFISFINYVLDCWLVYSFDDGLSSKTNELLKKKKVLLHNYDKLYLKQKSKIKDIYFSEKRINSELIQLIEINSNELEYENIPTFKSFLLEEKLDEIEKRKWSLYKDFIFRLLSIALIDNRFISYSPYVIKKIELDE